MTRLVTVSAAVAAVLGVVVVWGPLEGADSAAQAGTQAAPAVAAAPVSSVSAERQTALLASEDERLLTIVGSVRPGSAPYVHEFDGTQTLVLTAGGLAYGLADLIELGAAEVQPDGAVLLTEHVFVAPGARLIIDAPGTALRLRSDASGFVSLVAWKADMTLTGADGQPLAVTSWSAGERGPDSTPVDGRAYVRDASGAMELRHVAVSDLGFWSGRTSGVAWTGSSSTEVTGAILDSTFRDNHYGAFASQAEELTVTGSDFSDNAVDGLSLHRSTAQTVIEDSTARGNGRHGFSADQGSESVTYTDVTAEKNAAYGVFFSGTPLSDGRSAGGTSLRSYGQVQVDGGVFRQNGKAGLRVVDGDDVTITGTRIADNRDGIVLVGTSAPTEVVGSTVSGDHRFGITVTGGAAAVTGNKVSGSETAIRVRDAAVDVVDNKVREATAHAISVVGASAGSTVEENTIGGRGPSGLDVYRVAEGVSIDLAANDVGGWTRDRDNWTYWSTFIPNHPMLLLWVLVLGVPVLLGVRARRARVTPGTKPYGDDIRREWQPPARVEVGRRTTGGRL
ncbi:right-handed parallel beta-helix repeat-containing protein [Modestobacter sp. VKM Ac-2977]|uniref:right-handed parallel beta-helix repeat-containing protein n=1 Tax=Modestobacter sp. VKM Ac-2977 TaxID=3004131 RepID=UPI0022AABCB5|nr:right-handed parallel beta-helix repeat-containing protein [Modestobacter sp. VKM Ac-2977]MCZ2822539.1 right-handed parallel beta-helix repeat-containing protein [Modestobacter sp. VKM Ac-2977]